MDSGSVVFAYAQGQDTREINSDVLTSSARSGLKAMTGSTFAGLHPPR